MKYILLFLISLNHLAYSQNIAPFHDAKLPLDSRLNNLLSLLSIEEKISLLSYQNQGIPRLSIPAYNWWNEGLHGVARAGQATVFPQAIGMAASFNPELIYFVADAISTEARAKFNLANRIKPGMQYQGLTFWSPNINIFRDPRWGRGQETYGEDPFLTSQIGLAYVKGLQGSDPNKLKTAACAKHFAVHSGPEALRHSFDAVVDEKDLHETYLYAFNKLVKGNVESVMCAYNRLNGKPCCTNKSLLTQILRNNYGFKGQIVTDCWALEDIRSGHKIETDGAIIAAEAIKSGVNLECGSMIKSDLMKAFEKKLISELDIDSALAGVLRTQFKLGLFDLPSSDLYAHYGQDSVANEYHLSLARKMASESMVLLQNKNNVLPLQKSEVQSIMILGQNATSDDVLLGNYHGLSAHPVNFVSGLVAAVGAGTRVEYDPGYDLSDSIHFGGLWAASNAQISIAVIGNTPSYEGEDGDAFLSKNGGDRKLLNLPPAQIAFLLAYRKANPTQKLIVVITGGSCFDLSIIEPIADAILLAWYPGEQGGHAFADILFGKQSPSGHLPISYYQNNDELPAFDSYAMKGRTYRYREDTCKYPFGFGLGYSKFNYQWISKPVVLKDQISFDIQVKNEGKFDAAEVVQVYMKYPKEKRMPMKELKAFKKEYIVSGDSVKIHFSISKDELKKWDLQKSSWLLYPGNYSLEIGSSSKEVKLQSELRIKQ